MLQNNINSLHELRTKTFSSFENVDTIFNNFFLISTASSKSLEKTFFIKINYLTKIVEKLTEQEASKFFSIFLISAKLINITKFCFCKWIQIIL